MGKVVIATTTKYKDETEMRFGLALKTIQKAIERGYSIKVIDDSKNKTILKQLRKSGAEAIMGPGTTMGAARRKAFQWAIPIAGENGVIVWMEPEKHTFVPLISEVVDPILAGYSDVVIPYRTNMASYPRIQQHSEQLGNEAFRLITRNALDIYFGPQAFRGSCVHYYLDYKGEYGDKWDSIQVPVIRMIANGVGIAQVGIDYVHPEEQRTEETLEMLERRLEQITNLKKAVKEESIKLGLL